MKLELCAAVASSHSIVVRGAGTKNALIAAPLEAAAAGGKPFEIDAQQLQGIVTYDPSEFLITANAGTTIAELAAALVEYNQYLPFDPVLAGKGATLGGPLPAGLAVRTNCCTAACAIL